MRKGILMKTWTVMLTAALLFASGMAQAQDKDVFKGKLFPPNVILEHQAALNLSKDQYTAIRQAVVAVQAEVAEHEWDLREAYGKVMALLDASPIDRDAVLTQVDAALAAENKVKKMQVGLLVELRNLLSEDQFRQLQELQGR